MTKSFAVFALSAIITLSILSACKKEADTAAQVESPSAVTAPDKPAAPDAVSANAPQAIPAPAENKPSAAASADVSVNGTEARAGDVSVKLPD